MPRADHSSSAGHIKPFFGALGGIRVVHAASRHVFPRHSHDEFGIGIITAGCQRSSSGRGIVCADAGDVITVSPGEVHDGAPAYADSRSWSMIYLEPDLVGSFERELSGREQELEFAAPLLRDPKLAAQVRNLITIAQMEGLAAQAIALEQALCAVLAMTLQENVLRSGRQLERFVGHQPGEIEHHHHVLAERSDAFEEVGNGLVPHRVGLLERARFDRNDAGDVVDDQPAQLTLVIDDNDRVPRRGLGRRPSETCREVDHRQHRAAPVDGARDIVGYARQPGDGRPGADLANGHNVDFEALVGDAEGDQFVAHGTAPQAAVLVIGSGWSQRNEC